MSTSLRASVPATAGAFVATVGGVVLFGWVFDLSSLKSVAGAITMKANTAVALVACGASLWLAATRKPPHTGAVGCAGVAGAIGLLTLVEHLTGWNLGIDELLFTEAAGAVGTASPGRMGLHAAISFIVSAVALASLHRSSAQTSTRSQWLALLAATAATVALTGYLYGAQELYGLARYSGIAFHTVVSFLVLSAGILAMPTTVGPMATLAGDGPGGILMRRLLTPAILVPLGLGYALLLGQRAGFYDLALGTALLAGSLSLALLTTIWRTARRIDRTDAARRALLVGERLALEEAERAGRLKDEFLASLSHELRTPLTVLTGWIHLLRTETAITGTHRHAIDVISRNAALLTRLVEDLLDMSRLRSNRLRLELQTVDLKPLVAGAAEAMAMAADERGVTIRITLDGGDSLVEGDAARLQQILLNLLSNAIKFATPGSVVAVRTETSSAAVRVIVSDTGEGIAAEFLPHVFERFRQGDGSSTRQHGGLGLGLSLARNLTELHGGSIEADSAGRGQGATFTVTLPLRRVGVTDPAAAGPATGATAR